MGRVMARTVTLLTIIAVLDLVDPVVSDCRVPVLRNGAEDLVSASFKRGLRRTDFTKIEVLANPYKLVEDGASACNNDVEMSLFYNYDGGEDWTAVDVRPTLIWGGQYSFNLEDILPCKDHYFKLVLLGEGK